MTNTAMRLPHGMKNTVASDAFTLNRWPDKRLRRRFSIN